ncbi:MAG: UDP-glucose/GDP-mannose dehydrogenase family protein [Actinomycetota bacterium]|nr:UDP-glucose/GDP-mannose dehydrogenase family protein [Actinomycetota bacterium]
MADTFRIGVVGTGYVGLVTGACLSHLGHRVTCVDKDEKRIRGLKEGRMPFYEPALEELVSRGVRGERLSFAGSEGLARLVREADVVFIAVSTPQAQDGSADLSSVAEVARDIGRALSQASREHPLLVVNKSTVPVGSGDYVSMLIREGLEEEDGAGGEVNFLVASNPEFLREGSAIYDSLFPDRIVVGAESRVAIDILRALYEPLIEQSFATELDPRPKVAVPFVSTDLVSAEMIKYAANAFLATKVSFINEVATLCELVGADIAEVAYGIGLDERIGARFLSAGIGWGGSCFPKDISALRAVAREYEHETPLLDASVAVNERQRKQVISKLQGELHTLKGKRVALLGLSFKPNTDDLREAPSLAIARSLDSLGARVVGYDPVAGKAASRVCPSLKKIAFDPYEALSGAHAAVIVTEWEEIRTLDLERAAALMEEPKVLVDGRNVVLDPKGALEAGLSYRGFGRG